MKVHFILVVWGQQYVTDCIYHMLPLLSNAGNLPAWPWTSTSRLCVYTTPADWQMLTAASIWSEVTRWIEPEPHWIDGLFTPTTPVEPHKYDRLTLIHQQAIQQAVEQEASLFFLAPDLLLHEGSLAHLAALIATGSQGILTLGLYIHRFTKPFDRWTYADALNGFSTDLHLRIQHAFWEQSLWVKNPAAIGYHKSDGTTGFRSFCLHPLFIRQPRLMQTLDTIDASYLQQYADEWEQWTIIDPQQMICLTFQDDTFAEDLWPVHPQQRLLFLYQYASHLGQQMPIAYAFFAHEIVFPVTLKEPKPVFSPDDASIPLQALSWLLLQETWYQQQHWEQLLDTPWPGLPWEQLMQTYPLLVLLSDLKLSACYKTNRWLQLKDGIQTYAHHLRTIPLAHSRIRVLDYVHTPPNLPAIETVLGRMPQHLHLIGLSATRWFNPEQVSTRIAPYTTLVLLATQWSESEWELWQGLNWPGGIYPLAHQPQTYWLSCLQAAQQLWVPTPLEPQWESLVLRALLQGLVVDFWV